MTTKSKSYAAQINGGQIMSKALKTNQGTLEKRGITKEFTDTFETLLSNIEAKNAEQERLKADLKTATAALEALMNELHEKMRESTTIVKLEVPQSQWKEYGIEAKR